MRLRLIHPQEKGMPLATEAFNQKIEASCIETPTKDRQRRPKLTVSKTKRLVAIEFACTLDALSSKRAIIQFTESEILLMAKMCRRDRSDNDFLKAIEESGLDINAIRRTRTRNYLEQGPTTLSDGIDFSDKSD